MRTDVRGNDDISLERVAAPVHPGQLQCHAERRQRAVPVGYEALYDRACADAAEAADNAERPGSPAAAFAVVTRDAYPHEVGFALVALDVPGLEINLTLIPIAQKEIADQAGGAIRAVKTLVHLLNFTVKHLVKRLLLDSFCRPVLRRLCCMAR